MTLRTPDDRPARAPTAQEPAPTRQAQAPGNPGARTSRRGARPRAVILDFGLDLAGRPAPELRRGAVWHCLAAFVQALPYALLAQVLLTLRTHPPTAATAGTVLIGLAVCFAALVWLKARANVASYGAIYTLAADARMRVANHLASLPMGWFSRQRRADVAELLSGRYAHYQDVMARAWGQAVGHAALPVCLWGWLAWVDWRLAALTGLLSPLAFLAMPWALARLSRADARMRPQRQQAGAALQEMMDHRHATPWMDSDARGLRQTRQCLRQLEQAQLRTELAPAPALLVFSSALLVMFALTAGLACWLALRGALAAAPLLAGLLIALRFTRALSELGYTLAELRHARDTLADIRMLMQQPSLPHALPAEQPADAALCLRQVCFRYPDRDESGVSDVSANLPPGRFVAVVGASGAGKSTLAALAARLWDPDSGSICLGGARLPHLAADTLNSHVALVLQDVVLFDGSIADNIRLGRPQASDDDVRRAAQLAQAHTFIQQLPDGYDTVIRGDAPGLSGGQQQRIAIARALVKDAPVLILDEASASIDAEHAGKIQAALDALIAERTLLMIAHRLRTVTHADEIWVMAHGCIVERGTHAALLTLNGHYRQLWDAQTPDIEADAGHSPGCDHAGPATTCGTPPEATAADGQAPSR